MFFAETLGATEEQTLALNGTGLHYFFNSSKWWDFEQPWCLAQHEKLGKIAPSISFPESHDTGRLAADTDGNEVIQRQRYAFSAVFSAGLMIPIGYEFGFKERLDVVFTNPNHGETPTFDIRQFIQRVNLLKLEYPLLQGEGTFQIAKKDPDVLVLERRTAQAPDKVGWILVNKILDKSVTVTLDGIVALSPNHRLYRICRDNSPWAGELLLDKTVTLDPAEVALVLESQEDKRDTEYHHNQPSFGKDFSSQMREGLGFSLP
jgi:starch synthase (maltosyl-transferring)